MNKKLLQKLVAMTKKNIEALLVLKARHQEHINQLENQLSQAKQQMTAELSISNNFYFYETASFTANELMKQENIEVQIKEQQLEIERISEEIITANVEQRKYEHLLDDILRKENKAEEKREMQISDAFALLLYEKQ